MINELLIDFLNNNKLLIISFILITLLTFPTETILIPRLYGKLFSSKKSKIFNSILLIIGGWLLIQFFYVIKNFLEKKIMPKYLEYLRNKLFTQGIHKYEKEYQDIVSSNMVGKILNVSVDVRTLFGYFCNVLIPFTLSIIVVGIYFFYTDWKMGLYFVLILFLACLVLKNPILKLIQNGKEIQDQYLHMTDKMIDSYDNLMNVYLNNEKEHEIKRMNVIQNEYKDKMKEMHTFICNFTNIAVIMTLILFFGLISIVYLNLKNGKINFDQFMVIALVLVYFMGFMINISVSFPFEFSRLGYINSLKEFVNDLFDKKKKNYNKNFSIDGDIEFRNVNYAYDKNIIFDKLSLTIKNSSRVAIVGRSGCGKTTLMKLLLGLSSPKKGKIMINNNDIKNLDPVILRKQVVYVNQRTAMFDGTIAENMKYGNNISDQKLIEILKKYNFFNIFKDINKNVGYQGKALSGGMQKIIINIRGILKNGKIIIFDEPLAGLDGANRENMIKMIDEMTKGKTLIIITHDKEIFKIVDKIINLDKIKLNSLS